MPSAVAAPRPTDKPNLGPRSMVFDIQSSAIGPTDIASTNPRRIPFEKVMISIINGLEITKKTPERYRTLGF